MNGKGYRDTRVARSHDHTVTRTTQVRARLIGLIRIRTPPFSDEAFDWAHPNLDESPELIRLIRKIHG